ncbi:2TM domain-containing protein [Maribacter sp. ANRC-HE7]|uniref:2TM domain-containing protein n=1 Tax=Maribacter aquimaris TaxID=2737171 RepID=A0ABR7V0A1_9FLAO|nr:2TM domain-containing protein [Maribacter aquimaris]MBD0776691.1 2TM domain-containing protein [Maribacter aquimaris]
MTRFYNHFIRAIVIGTVIYFVFLAIYFFTGRFDEGFDYQITWTEYYQNMIFALILYMANAYWIEHLITTHKHDLFTLKRFAIGITGNILISIFGIFLSRIVLVVVLEKKPLTEFLANENLGYYQLSLIIAICISLIFYAVWYYKYRQENKVKEQKIIAGTASAKFDALKNQLDPHFLFNSLNVLTSLIEEDPGQAQKFTTSLSKVYRYVLEQKNKDLVSVDEEFQFAKTYVKLLKMRFEDSIHFDIPDHSSNPEAKIVPLSLQLLLENAVKHNVVTSARPLHIKVYEEGDMLVVDNNIQEKQVVKKSSGVGLRNIQQRYDILTNRQVEITKSPNEFRVKLPMLTKQVTIMEAQQTYIDDKRYEKAKEHVEQLKGFYGNLIAYCIVIPCLAILNHNTTSFPWIIFPTIGWGFGVVVHGMEVFGYNPLWGKSWQERKIRKYMDDENF